MFFILQVKDNTFNREEKLFRSLEKTVRLCVKNTSSCFQHTQVGEALHMEDTWRCCAYGSEDPVPTPAPHGGAMFVV